MRRATEELGIPVLAAPRGVRKEELVEPYYHRFKSAESVACVLTSMEQGRTFVAYTPHRKPPRDANHRPDQGMPKTIPALLLVRAGPGHGTDERAGC